MSDLPEGFDPTYYLLVHGEVAEAGMDPAEHYLKFGHAEGRTGVPPRIGYVTERDAAGRSDFFVKAFSAIATNGIGGPSWSSVSGGARRSGSPGGRRAPTT